MKSICFKNLVLLLCIFFIISCEKNNLTKTSNISTITEKSNNQRTSNNFVTLGLVSFSQGSAIIPLFGSGNASITVNGNGSITTTPSVSVPGQFTFSYSNGAFYTVTAKSLPSGNTDFVSFYAPPAGGTETCNIPIIYGQDNENTADYTIVLNVNNNAITEYKIKYRIQYSNSSWQYQTFTSNNTKIIISGLAVGTTYEFQIAKNCGSTFSDYTQSFFASTIM